MQHLLLNRIWFLRVAVFAVSALALFAWYQSAQAAGCPTGDVVCGVAETVGNAAGKTLAVLLLLIVQVFNILLGWVGMFFNWAILVTVFQFSQYFGNSEGLLLAWTILRDIANIGLLFGFVYIGIRTILDAANYDVKRTLPTFLIFAVLLNFSLFAGEAMIDVSNAIGSSIYAQATNVDCREAANVQECANQGIAGSVFQISGISSIGAAGQAFQDIVGTDQTVGAIGLSFALLVFVIVMIGVLVAGALMLISRAITLMLLLVVSPVGFAGMALPGLDKYSKKWWGMLVDNVLFAPVFVLLILIGLKIAEGLKASFVGPDVSITNVLAQPGENVGGIFMVFAIVIGFMIAALMSAKRFSVYGSQQAVSGALNFIYGTAGGNLAAMAGQGLLNRYDRTLSSVRPEVRGIFRALGGSTVDRAIRSGLKAPSTFTPAKGMTSYTDSKQKNDARSKELENIWKERETEGKAGETSDNISTAIKQARATGNTDDLETQVNKMSLATFKKLPQTEKKSEDLKDMARVMGAGKFKQVVEDKEIDDGVKKIMKDARYESLKKQVKDVQSGNAKAAEGIRKWAVDDIIRSGVMNGGSKEQEAVLNTMSDDQFDGLLKNDDFGTNTKDKFKAIRNGTQTGGRFDVANAEKNLGKMPPSKIAKLPGKTLTADHVIKLLAPKHFKEIAKIGELTGDDRGVLIKHVQSLTNAANNSSDANYLRDYIKSLPPGEQRQFKDFYEV